MLLCCLLPACLPEYITGQHMLQEYITAFQYNHTSTTYFDQNKQRPLCRLLSTARDIVRQGLPIKCVEAVFLGLLLTAGWTHLDRIPVGFKTCVAGHVYR